MKLSELIATLQTAMDEHGDTDEIALCFVIEGRSAHRLDVFGSVTVLHDTAEHPNGMAYLVADCNQQPGRRTNEAQGRRSRPAGANVMHDLQQRGE